MQLKKDDDQGPYFDSLTTLNSTALKELKMITIPYEIKDPSLFAHNSFGFPRFDLELRANLSTVTIITCFSN